MLEKSGIRIAAVSYDSPEILKSFADERDIAFPLLSDRDSAVIRRFGILNVNIAPGLRAHGVPHPVSYLVAPDGLVIRKYFVENYQHRVTAASVALREFGGMSENAAVTTIQSGALTAQIALTGARVFAGQEVSFSANFQLQPGWHIYGADNEFTATSVTFDDPKVVRQSFHLPTDQGPIYAGSIQAHGSLLLKFPIPAGKTALSGRLRFQQCSDTVCEPPETIAFELPLTLEVFVDAEGKK
jgi:hypothetical protein